MIIYSRSMKVNSFDWFCDLTGDFRNSCVKIRIVNGIYWRADSKSSHAEMGCIAAVFYFVSILLACISFAVQFYSSWHLPFLSFRYLTKDTTIITPSDAITEHFSNAQSSIASVVSWLRSRKRNITIAHHEYTWSIGTLICFLFPFSLP